MKNLLHKALLSQGGLAKLGLPKNEIHPLSLNTIKARANEAINGGFSALDELRKRASMAISVNKNQTEKPSRGTKSELQKHAVEQQEHLRQLHDEIALMSAKLLEYMEMARRFAEKAGEIDNFEQKQRELLGKFSPTHLPRVKKP